MECRLFKCRLFRFEVGVEFCSFERDIESLFMWRSDEGWPCCHITRTFLDLRLVRLRRRTKILKGSYMCDSDLARCNMTVLGTCHLEHAKHFIYLKVLSVCYRMPSSSDSGFHRLPDLVARSGNRSVMAPKPQASRFCFRKFPCSRVAPACGCGIFHRLPAFTVLCIYVVYCIQFEILCHQNN
jgi:hypothetical protein